MHFEVFMIKDDPSGYVGFANLSGWMTSDIFVKWLKQKVKNVSVLLVGDWVC